MSAFVNNTMSDIRSGRQSWRVLFVFSSLSFVIAIAHAAIAQPF